MRILMHLTAVLKNKMFLFLENPQPFSWAGNLYAPAGICKVWLVDVSTGPYAYIGCSACCHHGAKQSVGNGQLEKKMQRNVCDLLLCAQFSQWWWEEGPAPTVPVTVMRLLCPLAPGLVLHLCANAWRQLTHMTPHWKAEKVQRRQNVAS